MYRRQDLALDIEPMKLKTDYPDFIRYLKNEKFIEWKLFPTNELNAYWNDFLLNNPEEQKNIALAEQHFRQIGFSHSELPQEKKTMALKRLEQSLNGFSRKRKIRRFIYAAAASAAILVLSLIYVDKISNNLHDKAIASNDYIIGSKLKSEDILFITGDKTESFNSNIDIRIDGNETVRIKDGNNDEKEVAIKQNAINKLIVPYGKRSKVVLPDGTEVWLNSGSTLEFPTQFSKNRREIKLSGEIYIEVAHDETKPFYVHTSNFNIRVYGTKFNVSSYPGSASSVVLVEGSVGLQSDKKGELRLLPNEQAVYDETCTFNKQKVNVHPFICWKDGYLTFEDDPISEVLAQIGRYYNLSFNYEKDATLKDQICTGKIILSDNLDNVLTALSLISLTKYRKENNLIYIYK